MFKIIIAIAVAALGLWIIQQQLPDIQRYLRLRSM